MDPKRNSHHSFSQPMCHLGFILAHNWPTCWVVLVFYFVVKILLLRVEDPHVVLMLQRGAVVSTEEQKVAVQVDSSVGSTTWRSRLFGELWWRGPGLSWSILFRVVFNVIYILQKNNQITNRKALEWLTKSQKVWLCHFERQLVTLLFGQNRELRNYETKYF